MIHACITRLRRHAKMSALLPLAAALAISSGSPAAHAAGKPTPPFPPPPSYTPPPPPPPTTPPPPPTVQAVNGKCPPGYVIINPKSPSRQQICGRKVG